MYNGIINVYKEPGFTSFDVVAKLRGILKQKKIGHTGTLDPDAEGVLVVCLGKATKLCDVLTDKDKTYIATLLLGVSTDTEDISGRILEKKEVSLSEETVLEGIQSFVGSYDQVPPMFSAIKVNGKKLYELARQGQVIERQPRRVTIHEIEVMECKLPRVVLRISCSKGTYIRSLCRDMGNRLGVGGTMEHLIRESVISSDTGMRFESGDALTLSKIEALVKEDNLDSVILPIDAMFPNLSRLYVNEMGEKKLQNGNFLYMNDFEVNTDFTEDNGVPDGASFLIYDRTQSFKAIYCYHKKNQVFKADKMFL